jgi:hypothetical protein
MFEDAVTTLISGENITKKSGSNREKDRVILQVTRNASQQSSMASLYSSNINADQLF